MTGFGPFATSVARAWVKRATFESLSKSRVSISSVTSWYSAWPPVLMNTIGMP
ncbi:hypothetical protein D3C83_302320 [compost metagenome]